MSKLQEMLQKLMQVIVNYYETQTAERYSLEDYATKPPEELHEFLKARIDDATKKWETRRPLLEYFLFVIDSVKPLTDKETPLTKEEERLVLDRLVLLLTTNRHLLNTYQTDNINVKYGEQMKPMAGFVRGFVQGYSYCNTGQVVNSILFESLKITKETNITEMVQNLISSHQTPLLENVLLSRDAQIEELSNLIVTANDQCQAQQQITERLQKENEEKTDECEKLNAKIRTEQAKSAELIKQNTLQDTQISSLQEQNAQLLSHMTREQETNTQACEQLEHGLAIEKAKTEHVQKENKSLLEQQSILEKQLAAAQQKIEQLTAEMQEKSNLIGSPIFTPGILGITSFGNKRNFFTPLNMPPITPKANVVNTHSKTGSSSEDNSLSNLNLD